MTQTASADLAVRAEGGRQEATSFVINLTASTTPVALTQPRTAELKRFTFFVSRRREEGRERFRLHMGYFTTIAEAEQMLVLVRDVYPAAWVGPASGGRNIAPAAPAAKLVGLRSIEPAPLVDANMLDASPVAAAVDRIAVTAQPLAAQPAAKLEAAAGAPAPAPLGTPATPAAAASSNVPTLTVPTLAVAPATIAAVASPASAAPAAVPASAGTPPAPNTAVQLPASVASTELTLVADCRIAQMSLEQMSNVKEVLAALDDPAPAARRAVPELKPSKPAKAAAVATTAATIAANNPVAAEPAVAAPVATADSISDSQVLRMLEQHAPAGDEASANIKLVTPEDTQTLRIIKSELQRNVQPSYAVQLAWSVQPIDMSSLPQLAIFDAYKLYAVEGNRQGRRWYGLRLGFFTDVVSARQVASYVRADFQSVAVIPVTQNERDRATGEPREQAGQATAAAATRHPATPQLDEGFELLAEEKPAPAGTVKPVESNSAERLPPEPRRRRTSGPPQNLEQTLEILGATTLTLEKSTTILDDTGLGKPKAKPGRSSRFARLLEKLSDRLGQ